MRYLIIIDIPGTHEHRAKKNAARRELAEADLLVLLQRRYGTRAHAETEAKRIRDLTDVPVTILEVYPVGISF